MKVGLISPKWNKMLNSYPPLGLGYLAAFLEREGHQVRIFDLGLTPDSPLEQDVDERSSLAAIIAYAPDLIGLTAMTSNYHSAQATARLLKGKLAATIVIGGPHATVFPERVIQEACFDYLIYGEGEITLLELVKALEASDFRPSPEQLGSILGLCFKQEGQVRQNPPRPLIRDLDSLPFPARQLFDLRRYPLYTPHGFGCVAAQYAACTSGRTHRFAPTMPAASAPMITILSSRGCPYNCSYCFKGIVGRVYRQRSVENIIAEIREVIATYGIRNFYFIDDLFTINERRLRELAERMIAEGLDLRWQCLARVDKVTPEILALMYRAGCREIHYGIESGHQEMLDAIGKRITLQQVRQAVAWTRQAGIMSKGYFMLGLPGDTEATMEQTIRFAAELELDEAMFSLTTPFPGTRLWDELCRKRPGTEFDADFSRAYYYNSYTEEIAPFLNVSEVSDARLAHLIKEAKERFWEGKRRRKYLHHFGRPWGAWIWQLSNIPAVRACGRWLLNAGVLRPLRNPPDCATRGRTTPEGRANSWS